MEFLEELLAGLPGTLSCLPALLQSPAPGSALLRIPAKESRFSDGSVSDASGG